MVDINASKVKTYGIYTIPLAAGWESLATILYQLYAKRMATLPWVPEWWISHIAAINGQYDVTLNQKVVVLPATAFTLSHYGAPAFLDTQEKINVWNEVGNQLRKAYDDYAQNMADEGRIVMAQLYDDVAFWDRAIAIARILKTPLDIVQEGTNRFAFPALLAIGVFAAYGFMQRERRHAR